MYATVVMVCIAALLFGCSQHRGPAESEQQSQRRLIAGEWEWVRTENPQAQFVLTPAGAGRTKTLVLYDDNTYSLWFSAGEGIRAGGYYQLVMLPGVRPGEDSTLVLESDGRLIGPVYATDDSLYINGVYTDGELSVYARRRSESGCDDPVPVAVVDLPEGQPVRSDPYSIQDIEHAGDALCIAVQYSGGCRDHDLRLYVDRSVLGEEESLRMNAVLVHRAHGDRCEASVSRTVGFDLTLLKRHLRVVTGQRSGSVVLRITGGKEPYTVDCGF